MMDFSHRLKELRKNAQLNQKDIAEAIGVAQTAIANYESGNRFPSEDKLIKLSDFFGITLDMLLGREDFIGRECLLEKYLCDSQEGQFYVKLGDDIVDQLIDGKKQAVMDFILNLPKQGIFIHDIYHKVFQYVLYKTGWLWESGVIDVAKEHYISATIEQLMPLLMRTAHRKAGNGKKVICFTPEGEEHVLVNHMISDFLELEGFEAHFLGRSIPLKDLLIYIKKEAPDILVISITLAKNLQVLSALIGELDKTIERHQYKVIIGGNPFKGLTDSIKADAIGISLEDTVAKVIKLVEIKESQGGQHGST
jgi:methanogenic corrinoid protein MtbC1